MAQLLDLGELHIFIYLFETFSFFKITQDIIPKEQFVKGKSRLFGFE